MAQNEVEPLTSHESLIDCIQRVADEVSYVKVWFVGVIWRPDVRFERWASSRGEESRGDGMRQTKGELCIC